MNIKKYDPKYLDVFTEILNLDSTSFGLLDGLTFAVKDIIDIKSCKNSLGNPFWQETSNLAQTNATCVDQLLNAGARCIGKTVLSELGSGLTGINNFFGTPINPNAPHLFPGGSSSGSAVAVAAGLADFALGTDAGGSVRVPASYCGVYGMRPSTGLISMAGVKSLSRSFDTIGVFAQKLDVLLKVLSVLLPEKISTNKNVGSLYYPENILNSLRSEVKEAFLKSLESIGNTLEKKPEKIDFLDIDDEFDDPIVGWTNTFKTILCAEMWNELKVEVNKLNLELGKTTFVDFSRLKNIKEEQINLAMLQQTKQFTKLNNLLSPNNLLCIPTTPDIAPQRNDGETNPKNLDYSKFRPLLCLASLSNLPQLTLPAAMVDGAPLGISLMSAKDLDFNLISIVSCISKTL